MTLEEQCHLIGVVLWRQGICYRQYENPIWYFIRYIYQNVLCKVWVQTKTSIWTLKFRIILENWYSQIRAQTIASGSEPGNIAYSLFRILFGHLIIVESRYQHLSKFGTPLYLVATESAISHFRFLKFQIKFQYYLLDLVYYIRVGIIWMNYLLFDVIARNLVLLIFHLVLVATSFFSGFVLPFCFPIIDLWKTFKLKD
jgi:hypothetical protein